MVCIDDIILFLTQGGRLKSTSQNWEAQTPRLKRWITSTRSGTSGYLTHTHTHTLSHTHTHTQPHTQTASRSPKVTHTHTHTHTLSRGCRCGCRCASGLGPTVRSLGNVQVS